MNAAAQQAAIEKIMPRNCTFEEFLLKDSHASFALKPRTFKSKDKKAILRMVDWALWPTEENGPR